MPGRRRCGEQVAEPDRTEGRIRLAVDFAHQGDRHSSLAGVASVEADGRLVVARAGDHTCDALFVFGPAFAEVAVFVDGNDGAGVERGSGSNVEIFRTIGIAEDDVAVGAIQVNRGLLEVVDVIRIRGNSTISPSAPLPPSHKLASCPSKWMVAPARVELSPSVRNMTISPSAPLPPSQIFASLPIRVRLAPPERMVMVPPPPSM